MGSSFSASAAGPQFQPLWNCLKMEPASLHLRIAFLLHSSFKKLSHLCYAPRWEDLWCQTASQIKGINFLQLSNEVLASTRSSCLCLFSGGEIRKGSGNEGMPHVEKSRPKPSDGRRWTNILLAVNVLVYIAQIATQGKFLSWGAKINSLIDKGQFWRLATSSFLHVNVGHLMVNCYSLNSIGPTMENLSGPKRFLAVYFASAITSSATSYWLCKAPAVGASGAIFGLVGSLAVFITRHKGTIGGGKEELQHIAQVILLNMAIGVLSEGIDNWGHLGGLIGGVATSWLVGPAWKYESQSIDGGRIFVDTAPIKYLINRKREHKNPN